MSDNIDENGNSEHIAQLLEIQKILQEKAEEIGGSVAQAVALVQEVTGNLKELDKGKAEKEAKIKSIESSNSHLETLAANKDKELRGLVDKKNNVRESRSLVGGAGVVLAPFTGGLSLILTGGALEDAIRTTSGLNQAIKKLEDEAGQFRNNKDAVYPHQAELNALIEQLRVAKEQEPSAVAQFQDVTARRDYGVLIDVAINDAALQTSRELHKYAQRNGKSIDNIITAGEVGAIACPPLDNLIHGKFGLAHLQALETFAADMKGSAHEASAEIRTLVQFINHYVIPNRDQFEIWASKIDDLMLAGMLPAEMIARRPQLEILRQKPVSLSLRRDIPDMVHPAATKALEEHALDIAYYYDPEVGSVLEQVDSIGDAVELYLTSVNSSLLGTQQRIAHIINSAHDTRIKESGLTAAIAQGVEKNSNIDQEVLRSKQRVNDRINQEDAAANVRIKIAAGAGFAIRLAVIASGGGDPGQVPPEVVLGVLYPVSQKFGQKKAHALMLEAHEIAVAALETERFDVETNQTMIKEIRTAIQDFILSRDFEEIYLNETSRLRLQQGLLMQSVVNTAKVFSAAINEICVQNGTGSIDDLILAYGIDPRDGRIREALVNLAFGVFNSNDLKVITDEGNQIAAKVTVTGGSTSQFGRYMGKSSTIDYETLDGQPLSEREVTMLAVVEQIVKPNIGAFKFRGHKNDALQQANMIGSVLVLVRDREIVRDATDSALGAIFKDEFGLSLTGQRDVRLLLDYWMHRHGERRLFDTLVRDDIVSENEAPKSIQAWNENELLDFIDRVRHRQAFPDSNLVVPGSTVLRIGGFAYFAPHAIDTADKSNVFEGNVEGYASHAMASLVISNFTERFSLSIAQDYRKHVQDKLDALITQSFLDFFEELGQLHLNEQGIEKSRINARKASQNSEVFQQALDDYIIAITKDAVGRFDLFLQIYSRNLEEQLDVATLPDRKVLQEQIDAIEEITGGVLNPSNIVRPGTFASRIRALDENHTFGNTSWKGRRAGL